MAIKWHEYGKKIVMKYFFIIKGSNYKKKYKISKLKYQFLMRTIDYLRKILYDISICQFFWNCGEICLYMMIITAEILLTRIKRG